ncbi:MAG TPA: hypothetical protein VGY50_00970, partial [Streptosporangiaceae bacterium]|nr:hypothetical protein [Streptosporangiaceae bacterium]
RNHARLTTSKVKGHHRITVKRLGGHARVNPLLKVLDPGFGPRAVAGICPLRRGAQAPQSAGCLQSGLVAACRAVRGVVPVRL